jgi:hypothetical protein
MIKILHKKLHRNTLLFIVCVLALVILIRFFNRQEIKDTQISDSKRMSVIVNTQAYTGGPCEYYVFNEDGKNSKECVVVDIDAALLKAGFSGTLQELYDQNIQFLKIDVDATTSIKTLTGSTPKPNYKDYIVYKVSNVNSAQIYKPE